MKLLDKKLIKRFIEIGDKQLPNPLVLARFFHTPTGWEWYVTNYYPEQQMFYGWIAGADTEMSYFGIDELDDLIIWGVAVERDPSWKEMHLDQVKVYAEA